MGLYPKGKYPTNDDFVCGARNSSLGVTCIIDNKHPGRNHWGPDSKGNYREWARPGRVFPVAISSEEGG